MEQKRTIYLGGERISVGGFLELMNCDKCNFITQRLILQADTDVVYMGVVGLTDLKRKRVVITHVNREEWNKFKEYVPIKLEERINEIFNVNSFKHFQFQKDEMDKSKGSNYKINCPDCAGKLVKVKYQSFDEYIENGGEILSIDQYKTE